MGKFILSKRKNGEFQFNLKAGNGEIILTSEGYVSKSGCQNGVESVKKNATLANRFDTKTAKDGRHYFNLKAGNGEIIGTSQMYSSASGRDNGIASVQTNAPSAPILDETT